MNNTDDTEYEEDEFDGEGYQEDESPEPEVFAESRELEGYPRQHMLLHPHNAVGIGHVHLRNGHQPQAHGLSFPRERATTIPMTTPHRLGHEFRDNANVQGTISRLDPQQPQTATPTAGPSRLSRLQVRHGLSVADVLPVVESSASPSPNELLPNDSGSGFLRAFPTFTPPGSGTLTPDLNYAEIGHGRGGQGSTIRGHPLTRERTPRQVTSSRLSPAPEPPLSNSSRANSDDEDEPNNAVPLEHTTPIASHLESGWVHSEADAGRELQDSVHSALGGERRGRPQRSGNHIQGSRSSEPRARSVKRTIRNTLNAAENYASSLLFGRSSADNVRPDHNGTAGAGPSFRSR